MGSNWCNLCTCGDNGLDCAAGGCVGPAPNCTLQDGSTVVQHGWTGVGTGADYCNTCRCEAGQLACTERGCVADDGPDFMDDVMSSFSHQTTASLLLVLAALWAPQ
mmetsp:Transcript_48051/g.114197  ORF Transcript_48051/g.114197 Transcript_48051/m.114197 type:complete len:106 (+) Transcript_48051:3-320(+)